jgi:Helix-turn-helix domain
MDDETLTERDLAALLKRSARTLQGDRIRGGGIPFVKVGAHVRYRVSDVLSYLDSHTQRSTSDRSDAT